MNQQLRSGKSFSFLLLLVSIVIVIAVTLDIVRGAIVQPTVIPTNPCSAQNIAQEINIHADYFCYLTKTSTINIVNHNCRSNVTQTQSRRRS